MPPHQYHLHPLPQHYQHYLTSPRMHHFPRNNASTQVVSPAPLLTMKYPISAFVDKARALVAIRLNYLRSFLDSYWHRAVLENPREMEYFSFSANRSSQPACQPASQPLLGRVCLFIDFPHRSADLWRSCVCAPPAGRPRDPELPVSTAAPAGSAEPQPLPPRFSGEREL